MQLPDMEIRPRGNWEAVDLGVRLAQRHLPRLMLAWAALTVPVFLLLTLLLWAYPTAVMVIFWWLKPLFDRLPLHILSRALFGEPPSVGQSLRALPKALRPQWFASLTWRRLTPTRSFDLPVTQLEGLAGKARQQRLAVLGQRTSRVASWLTIIGVHVEMALTVGLLSLLYLLLPKPVMAQWQWQDMLAGMSEWLWLEHLSNALYVIVLTLWEPLYVACGFSLYLNRRTELEGWDIELGFRRLRQRLQAAVPALVVVLCLLTALPTPGWAATPGPDAARLQHQALTGTAAREQIAEVLAQPPFEHTETVTRWRLAGSDAADEQEDDSPFDFLDGLPALHNAFNRLAPLTETLLWIGVFTLLALTLWRHRQWLRLFGVQPGRRTPRTPPPAVLFGLAVAPDSLPSDVAGEAERLWERSPRQALSLLYRATLSHLLHDWQLPLKHSHTEGEILALLAPHGATELQAYAEQLTAAWQAVAYGHQALPGSARSALCQGYRTQIARETPA